MNSTPFNVWDLPTEDRQAVTSPLVSASEHLTGGTGVV